MMNYRAVLTGMLFGAATLTACDRGPGADRRIERLVELTQGYEYFDFDTDWQVTDIAYDEALHALTISTESTAVPETATATIPLQRAAFAETSLDESTAVGIFCVAGYECLAVERGGFLADALKTLGGDATWWTDMHAFGCDPSRCDEILSILDALRADATSLAPFGPRPREQLVPEINRLGAQFSYSYEIERQRETGTVEETVRRTLALSNEGAVEVDVTQSFAIAWSSSGKQDTNGAHAVLTFDGDAVDASLEAAPVGRQGVDEPELVQRIWISCRASEPCISVISGDDSPARIARAPWHCLQSRCRQLLEDLQGLFAAAMADAFVEGLDEFNDALRTRGNANPAPAAEEPRPPRELVAAANRVNTRIDRAAAPLPGLLPTAGIAPLGNGRLALHTDSCAAARSGCGAGAITGNEVVVAFNAADINTSSLGIQPTASGYAVTFSCAAGACIGSPDGGLQLAGYGVACADQSECNHLMIDLLSLLEAARP
jgi:hypothetical protein